jgi:hypothetical protein
MIARITNQKIRPTTMVGVRAKTIPLTTPSGTRASYPDYLFRPDSQARPGLASRSVGALP